MSEIPKAYEPQSVEAAIHRLVPIAADLRQQLHDGLCLIYGDVQPADPRERRAIEGFYRQAVVKLGALLVASQHLAVLRRAGLVTSRRDGNTILYRLTDDRVLEAYRLIQDIAR